jgi:hypothetical protein
MLASRPAPGTVLPAVTRPLLRLRQLLRELAVQGPAPEPSAAGTGSRVVASGDGARPPASSRTSAPR